MLFSRFVAGTDSITTELMPMLSSSSTSFATLAISSSNKTFEARIA